MNEFPLKDGLIYLNHAAVAPWPQRTHDAVTNFAAENIHYGASRYPEYFSKKENELRRQLRELINAPAVNDIALLKSTSEALSVVAEGVNWNAGDNVVTSNEEFPSNRIPWEAQAKHGVQLREVNLHCTEPEQALIAACDQKTRLLTISSVQYASGIRLNLDLLGDYCQSNNILFCVDAIQSLGAHEFDVQKHKADFVMADGHKWMLGPEGIALFYVKESLRDELQLHQYGWHMVEDAGNYDTKAWTPASSAKRFECGSANMLGIHALSASLSLILETGIESIETAISNNIDFLYEQLSKLPDIHIKTSTNKQRRAGIIVFQVKDADHKALHKALMKKGVICAYRGGGIRFSPHFYVTQEQLQQAVDIVAEITS